MTMTDRDSDDVVDAMTADDGSSDDIVVLTAARLEGDAGSP